MARLAGAVLAEETDWPNTPRVIYSVTVCVAEGSVSCVDPRSADGPFAKGSFALYCVTAKGDGRSSLTVVVSASVKAMRDCTTMEVDVLHL